MKRRIFTLVMAFLLVPLSARCHRISLFLEVKGVAVEGFAYFSNGTPARNSPVEVYGPGNQPLWKGKTDREGKFQFIVQETRGPLRVVVNALDGHKAEENLDLHGEGYKKTHTTPPPRGVRPSQVLAGLGWIMGIFGIFMFWLSYRHES